MAVLSQTKLNALVEDFLRVSRTYKAEEVIDPVTKNKVLFPETFPEDSLELLTSVFKHKRKPNHEARLKEALVYIYKDLLTLFEEHFPSVEFIIEPTTITEHLTLDEDDNYYRQTESDHILQSIYTTNVWKAFIITLPEIHSLFKHLYAGLNHLQPEEELYPKRRTPLPINSLHFGFATRRLRMNDEQAYYEAVCVQRWTTLVCERHIPGCNNIKLPLLDTEPSPVIIGLITCLIHWFAMPVGNSLVRLMGISTDSNRDTYKPQTLDIAQWPPLKKDFLAQLKISKDNTLLYKTISEHPVWSKHCPKIVFPWNETVYYTSVYQHAVQLYVYDGNQEDVYPYIPTLEFV